MKRLDKKTRTGWKNQGERGVTLIELMMALLILAVGMAAITTLLITVMSINNRNSRDTTATLLAQKVIEQIASVNPNSGTNQVTIADCQGNSITMNVADSAGPAGAGASLVTSTSSVYYGGIDPTQAYSSVPSGYAMQYVDCSSAGGTQTTYDVRWNVMTIRSGYSRLITVEARPLLSNSSQLGGRLFAIPVSLRAIGSTAP